MKTHLKGCTMQTQPQHVVIIGAGLIGAATDYFLTQRGVRVTILEKGAVAGAATGRSFGWINANFAETPEYFALRVAGIEAYHDLPASISKAADLQFAGSLWWEDEGEALEAHSAYLTGLGYANDVLGSRRIQDLVPSLRTVPQQAIWAQSEASVDTVALTKTLLQDACLHGATVWDGCSVTGLRQDAGGIIGVNTDRGVLDCDQVVVAVGAETQEMLAPLGLRLPMDNKQGILVQTTPCKPLISHLLLTPKIHFRQGADGRFLMGQIFSGDADGTPPQDLADQMLRFLKTTLDGTNDVHVERIVLGTRPVPEDGFPAVGRFGDMKGLYVAATHSGITLGPLLGQIIASEVMGGADDARLNAYRPDRFA